ncbi:hypothetical protein ILUMI_14036 [Ignelater luminosus]|uniref:MD-2-related lipid-recognition domain-containing protein n=1 Tax=Ignelater luminosus TaxID=2038154 RepID=A0A8K0G846_IGNLU|nr:hypothetical protein ILUMI_14036 [Ignelater luminosus]
MLFRILLLLCSGIIVEASNNSKFVPPAGPPDFIYHDFFDCGDKKPTPINFTVIPTWFNKTHQVLEGNMHTPVAIGDNILVKISLYTNVHNKWLHVTNVSGKTCQMLRNYMGPLREEILSPVGLPADTCPIPRGTYHAKNVHLDMKNSRLPAFPYGTFKLFLAMYDIFTDVLQMCLGIHFENKS